MLGFGNLSDCGGECPHVALTLDLGRARRSLNTALRRALVVRAGGYCEMPGCDRPASWCEGHHIRHWVHGGPTALHNLLLLCRRHHVLVHRPGWDIHLDPTGTPSSPHPHSSIPPVHRAPAG
ncbi:MAG: HNH endonuclease signature motif containing protein [Pseudonocardiaceae bacterium]